MFFFSSAFSEGVHVERVHTLVIRLRRENLFSVSVAETENLYLKFRVFVVLLYLLCLIRKNLPISPLMPKPGLSN